MMLDLLKKLAEDIVDPNGDAREASTRSAGAQPSERRTSGQQTGRGRPWKESDVQMVTLRLRRPIVEAVEEAVKGSPIEFGNASDFYRRAIEHELARRGLLKTYKG